LVNWAPSTGHWGLADKVVGSLAAGAAPGKWGDGRKEMEGMGGQRWGASEKLEEHWKKKWNSVQVTGLR